MPTPRNDVYWYTLEPADIIPLQSNISAEVAVIGGGMAGLTCAQALAGSGLEVVLLERDFCGAGATGKSSGFITPDSELGLGVLLTRFGPEKAKALWDFVTEGVEHIRKTILDHRIPCDYEVQDSLYVANSSRAVRSIEKEHLAHQQLGYASTLYSREMLGSVLGPCGYAGGVRYGGTFGIDAYLYCQGLKRILRNRGVAIYEHTPVVELLAGRVKTKRFTVIAKHVVLCLDRYAAALGVLRDEVYGFQTFLGISSPLSSVDMKAIFPAAKLMVWDSDLIYQYYRMTGENRLLVGGSSLLYTYLQSETRHRGAMVRRLERYARTKIGIERLEIEYIWPGIIGVTKDFLPVAGRDPAYRNAYYIGGVAGLPWAAALGNLVARAVVQGGLPRENVFDRHRRYPINTMLQRLLSRPVAFGVSHGIVKCRRR